MILETSIAGRAEILMSGANVQLFHRKPMLMFFVGDVTDCLVKQCCG